MVLMRMGRQTYMLVESEVEQPFWRRFWNMYENPLKIFILFELAITLLVYFRNQMDKYTKMCSNIFIIISKEKKTKTPEEPQGLVKLWFIHVMEFNAAIKNDDLWAYLLTWKYLAIHIKYQKNLKRYIYTLIYTLGKLWVLDYG